MRLSRLSGRGHLRARIMRARVLRRSILSAEYRRLSAAVGAIKNENQHSFWNEK